VQNVQKYIIYFKALRSRHQFTCRCAYVRIIYLSIYLSACLSGFLWSTGLLDFSRYSLRFTTTSHVKFLCFTTLSSSFLYFASGRPRHHLPPNDQVITRLGPLLFPMLSTSPYHFNTLFSSLSKIICFPLLFVKLPHFLLSGVWRS
jgi:hypothetical protein